MGRNLQTIGQLAKSQPWTETQCRWWIKNAASNGLAHAIERVGGRVLIDADKLGEWLATQAQRRASADGAGGDA